MAMSPKAAAEIRLLMRDPDALRDERAPSPGGRGHYDPTQPRVPAGDPRGGQFASKGYRGGDSGRDAVVTPVSFDGTQLAQLGQGNPRDAFAQVQPFDGLFGDISAAQHLTSQNGFIRAERDRVTNPRTQVRSFEAGAGGPNTAGDTCSWQPRDSAPRSIPAACKWSSRQPLMHMTDSPARMPQFGPLLRAQ